MKNNRRDRILIFSDMLSYASCGIGRTELMCKAGLSSAQLNKYMPLLIKSELLNASNHKTKFTYKTTAKGRNFLETIRTIYEQLT